MKRKILDITVAGILIMVFAFGIYFNVKYLFSLDVKLPPLTGAVTKEATGAATSEQIVEDLWDYKKSENYLGAYTINPSFVIETENIFLDYAELEKLPAEIEKRCYAENIEPLKCIENYMKSYRGNLEFSLGACGTQEEIILENSKETLYDCAKSADTDCVCEFSERIFKDKNSELSILKDISGKRVCEIPKKIYRFCATPKQSRRFIRDGKITYERLPIKFALYINDQPPPIIESLEAESPKSSDKTLMLKWKKSSAADAARYRIYYSIYDFSGAEIKDHKLILPNGKFYTADEFNLQTAEAFKSIDTDSEPECVFAGEKCAYKYKAVKPDGKEEKISLAEEKLYYIESENSYIIIIKGFNPEKYFFAVTAIDKNDNEISNKKENQKLASGKNFNSGTAKDTLAPGIVKLLKPEIIEENGKSYVKIEWNLPENNIDGTPNIEKDISSYKIYSDDKNFDTVTGAEKLSVKITKALVPISGFKSGKENYIAVIAEDNEGNMHKENVISASIVIP